MKIYLLKVFVLLALFTTASVRAESVNESSPSTKMLMYIHSHRIQSAIAGAGIGDTGIINSTAKSIGSCPLISSTNDL